MSLLWKNNGVRNGDAQFARQRVVEEFVIGAPPKRIVDDNGAAQNGILQIRAVELDVVRDAVDDHLDSHWVRPF